MTGQEMFDEMVRFGAFAVDRTPTFMVGSDGKLHHGSAVEGNETLLTTLWARALGYEHEDTQ